MNENKISMGDAPCGNCRERIYNIPVLVEAAEPDGSGGTWFKVQHGTSCPQCGEPFNVYHLPPKESRQ